MSHPRHDQGFTLVEVLVVMALMGLMMAIAVSGWASWARASEQQGTAREIQSALRDAQQHAVMEGRSMCVWFDTAADTYTVYRGRCDDASKVQVRGPLATGSPRVVLSAPAFTASDGSSYPGVTFRPTGSAWPGQVQVRRDGSAKVYTVSVEGMTGRVSLG